MLNKQQTIYLFTRNASARLLYVSHIVFDLLMGLKCEICVNLEEFKSLDSPKINYSALNIENSFHILPAFLLFENEIRSFIPNHVTKKDIPFLFPTDKGDLGFDPLAASFYITSRYEEYISNQKDKHDRFPAEQSIQYKLDCLHLPIVQLWAIELGNALLKQFPSLEIKKTSYKFQPTFDIDMAWSYKEKGPYRLIGAYLRDALRFNIHALIERTKVLVHLEKDPFDTFAYIDEQTRKNKLSPCYFFLMGKNSAYDKNIDPKNTKFVQLIQHISTHNSIGIHPSYYADHHLETEIEALHSATGKTITHSRQHFIRLQFPGTYQHLINNNIEQDYSMGYPDKVGFRNGLAVPSYWYDLEAEEQTQLLIHPFQIMDVTLKNYLKLNPEQAIDEAKKIADTIHKYGGTMISIWHNSSFDKQWTGWDKVFEEVLSYAGSRLSSTTINS